MFFLADFDRFDKYDPKMKDWRIQDKWDWNDVRNRMTNGKQELMCLFNIPSYDVPELVIGSDDYKLQFEAWDNVSAAMGEEDEWYNNWDSLYFSLPRLLETNTLPATTRTWATLDC